MLDGRLFAHCGRINSSSMVASPHLACSCWMQYRSPSWTTGGVTVARRLQLYQVFRHFMKNHAETTWTRRRRTLPGCGVRCYGLLVILCGG